MSQGVPPITAGPFISNFIPKKMSPFQIHLQHFSFLNISLYLNNISFIRELSIENSGNDDTGPVDIKISADLNFIEPYTYTINKVPAKTDVKIPLKDLKINRGYLSSISETEKIRVTITVEENKQQVYQTTFAIEVHPLEYFAGFQILPELITAYITPNHSYVYHIKRKAAAILEKNNHHPAFEGYQNTHPERIVQIISAIYTALQSEEIVYSSLPPGYEENGQRLRLLSTIQQEKFGNCIDLSLLMAACLEACHLNPVLVIVQGHAFTGCWLYDNKFAETINDDKTAITKRVSKGIREIAVIETTSICKGNNITFTDALNAAERQLIEQENFIVSIDVQRARSAGIKPLPLANDGTDTRLEEPGTRLLADMEDNFDIGTIYTDALLQNKPATTKQKIWERKLLDLSLRNNLLNIRMTRSMLQLVDIDLSRLEDILSEGKSFSVMPAAGATVLNKYNLFTQPLHHSSPLYQLANDDLKHQRLHTFYHADDLENILSHIHKNTRQAIEENGTSTLYLAAGLVKWYDVKTPGQARYAPLLLFPVEMGRRSVNSKFSIKSREEEPMINITLLEFLRQEYKLDLSAMEQLPYDDKGIDVAKVMGTMRRALMALKGWDIEEQLILGNFSFSKLILWKDITAHKNELLKSNMVRSLIEGKLIMDILPETVTVPNDLNNIPSQEVILPIATDASQMEAILTAQKGQSFILHGPPGTGKSQTITNIIADALYRGKRVLFVAAKKAALDVVHKRLEQIGLDPFSLELHSNKSKKSDVLAQLSKTLEVAKITGTINFTAEAKRLDTAKKAISDYINILHHPQPVGWSLYDSLTALEDFKDHKFSPAIIETYIIQQLTAMQWQQWTDWLPGYQAIATVIVHPAENPLNNLQLQYYTPALHDSLSAQIQKLLTVLPRQQQQLQAVALQVHFPYSFTCKTATDNFIALMQTIKVLPNIPLHLAAYLSVKENYTAFENWVSVFEKYQHCSKQILLQFNRNILSFDISGLHQQWKQAQQKWWIARWLKKKKIKKQLSVFAHEMPVNDLVTEKLFSLNDELQEVHRLLQMPGNITVQLSLKTLFKGEQTDVIDLQLKATLVQRLNTLMTVFDKNGLTRWIQALQLQEWQYTDDIKHAAGSQVEEIITVNNTIDETLKAFRELTRANLTGIENWPEIFVNRLYNIQQQLPGLKNWMNYVQLRQQAKNMHLQWLIDAFEKNECTAIEISAYFQYSVHYSLVKNIIASHESLNLFNTVLFENSIEQYKKIALNFQQLTIQQLRIQLSARLPDATREAMQSSEIGILQRAIKNRGRGISIRRLFDQVPTLLPRLAPCMLMSPISVAQYFDMDNSHFDIVIFDEASQLPTCEAVSALARARQAIIVGDPKQMPPTSFFTVNKPDEENIEIEDLESILDDGLSLSMPSGYLLRHYRSKHESLIAFSNAHYYDNKLLTFPSADDINRKVQYHHIPGYYDKGSTRTNHFEATALVAFIKQHYSDVSKKHLSLGVVTFSQTQQNLVEDKLQQLLINDPVLEQMITASAEPLFIKNLENVQGDERDIILFSVGYAPDSSGNMTMNFGPLNRNGGWRRLNVAVTRARYEMHVFATLKADQINLSRTAAEGVAGLKAFLQFAEKGHLAVNANTVPLLQPVKHLAHIISQKLTMRGLQVKTDIGSSQFKIDIGIVHPLQPAQYILGIILDGQYYYNARTANDREIILPSVLNMLGWHIYRVWIIDWHENAAAIINDIVEKVNLLKEQPYETIYRPERVNIAAPVSEILIAPTPLNNLPVKNKQRPYIAHTLTPVKGINSEGFYNNLYRTRIQQQLQMLIDAEAPISQSLLYKKLLAAWNISRVSTKLDTYLQCILKEMPVVTTLHHQPFYWTLQDAPETLGHYRDNSIEKRNIEDIAPEEITIAIQEVIALNFSIEEDELIHYLTRCFGFLKTGKQINTLLRYTIKLAIKAGKIEKEGNRVKVIEGYSG